jgi:Na+/H+ antiporter NhaC
MYYYEEIYQTMKKAAKFALIKTIPIFLGYLFLGIAFGLLLQKSGLGVFWAFLISTLVYAGSMQFALVGILTGGLAREIALKNGIDPRRSASLLDIFSCVFQGLIPWAAQLLLAGSLAKISPLEITINNWYCMLLAVAGILAIILGLPRIKARSTEA